MRMFRLRYQLQCAHHMPPKKDKKKKIIKDRNGTKKRKKQDTFFLAVQLCQNIGHMTHGPNSYSTSYEKH